MQGCKDAIHPPPPAQFFIDEVRFRSVFNNPIGRVRAVGLVEGVSFLVLLFGAMPLKYVFKLPEGEAIVFWVGLVHGLLFISYATVAFRANYTGHLSKRLLGLAAIASVLPFGPF